MCQGRKNFNESKGMEKKSISELCMQRLVNIKACKSILNTVYLGKTLCSNFTRLNNLDVQTLLPPVNQGWEEHFKRIYFSSSDFSREDVKVVRSIWLDRIEKDKHLSIQYRKNREVSLACRTQPASLHTRTRIESRDAETCRLFLNQDDSVCNTNAALWYTTLAPLISNC